MEPLITALQEPKTLSVVLVVLVVLVFMRWGDKLWRQLTKDDSAIQLRSIRAYQTLSNQVGRAIETERQLHFSTGRGSLSTAASPASVAAITILDRVAEDGCASDVPPIVTVGDGTLLPLAQSSLYHAFTIAGRPEAYTADMVRFVSAENYQMSYAAAVNETVHYDRVASNIIAGRVGTELPIILEAGSRENINQVVGTDDLVAAALATAVTENVLIGEELLAAHAYLKRDEKQLSLLRVQDLLRLLIIVGMILWALYQMVG